MGEGGGSLVISRAAKIELCQQQLRGKPFIDDENFVVVYSDGDDHHGDGGDGDDDDVDGEHSELSYASTG